jgi:DnaK suppressor protein
VYTSDLSAARQAESLDDEPRQPVQSADGHLGVDLGLLDELTEGLAEVQGALERLDAGTYGRCSECGDAIDDLILEESPTASLCPAHLPFSPDVGDAAFERQV